MPRMISVSFATDHLCGFKFYSYLFCVQFGRIFTFGSGKKGQLGHGDSEVETNPKQVGHFISFDSIKEGILSAGADSQGMH